MDLSGEPDMFYYRALAYYLYPIDIRDIRRQEKDSVMILSSEAYSPHIPENFKILGSIDERCFLAVKKEAAP